MKKKDFEFYILFFIDIEGKSRCKTSLYDFRRQPLDIHQYNTFLEYIRKNGLNCNSTVVYLCTDQGSFCSSTKRFVFNYLYSSGDDNEHPVTMPKKKSKITSSILTSSLSNSFNSKEK